MRPKSDLLNKTDNEALLLIEETLLKQGKTWEDFIEKFSFDRQVVRMWLTGNKNPSINSFNQLSVFTKIPLIDLLELTYFSLSRENDYFETKIPDLIKDRKIEAVLIYKDTDITRREAQAAKSSPHLPQYDTLLKFMRFFKIDSLKDILKLKS